MENKANENFSLLEKITLDSGLVVHRLIPEKLDLMLENYTGDEINSKK